MRKKRAKKRKFKIIRHIFIIFFLLGVFLLGGYINFQRNKQFYADGSAPVSVAHVLLSETGEHEEEPEIFYCARCEDEFLYQYLSEDFLNKEREIRRLFGYDVSVIYKGLTQDNISLAHNETTAFYGASIVKMALGIYIYQRAERYPDLLDRELMFTESNQAGGSGVMKEMDLTRPYSIRELVKYLIEESDNIAFFMLRDEFNYEDVRRYWQNLNTTYTFVGWDRFGQLNGNDARIYSEELYRYLSTGTPLSSELGEYFLNAAKDSIIQTVIDKPIYFKYGETEPHYHEVAIVGGEHPYILVILTNLLGYGHDSYIMDVAARVDELNTQYWKERTDFCNDNHRQ